MDSCILKNAKLIYDFHSLTKTTEKCDFILATGSQDLRPALKASQLYLEGKAGLIVCSGGFGKITKNIWETTEAEKYFNICIENGVPEQNIVVENESGNSGENFLFSKELLKRKNLSVKKGIIVSKSYLSRRQLATGQKQWPEIEWYTEPPRISFEDYANDENELENMINLMVGDLQRLAVYYDMGYQTYVEIPGVIKEAYAYLVDRGYTRELLEDKNNDIIHI